MAEQIYKPKTCAFHPKELIFNFCKNADCLLPLCPTCVKVHTEEHRAEQSYGQFENIHKAVGDLDKFYQKITKELKNCSEDIKQHGCYRRKQHEDVQKRIAQAKAKMLTIVERFFTDFEKEVSNSMLVYNQSMKEGYGKVQQQIQTLKKEIQEQSTLLEGQKVLKVLIGFHAKQEQIRYHEELAEIKEKLEFLQTQKVDVICQQSALQSVIDEMGNYVHLSYQNWENEIKYVAQFVKTGFNSTSSGGFQKTQRGQRA